MCVNARDLDGAVARLDGAPAELLADVEVRALEAVVELRHEPAGVAALPLDRDERPEQRALVTHLERAAPPLPADVQRLAPRGSPLLPMEPAPSRINNLEDGSSSASRLDALRRSSGWFQETWFGPRNPSLQYPSLASTRRAARGRAHERQSLLRLPLPKPGLGVAPRCDGAGRPQPESLG